MECDNYLFVLLTFLIHMSNEYDLCNSLVLV